MPINSVTHQDSHFFFNVAAVSHFLAVEAIEDPYTRKISRHTSGSDSFSEKLVRSMREDLGLIEHVDKDGLKKIVGYTERGRTWRDHFVEDIGIDPESAIYDPS
jgi:hypothetical protein